MIRDLVDAFMTVIDGVCVKGAAGACLTWWLGTVNMVIAIVAGLVTIGYVAWKWRMAVLDRRKTRSPRNN